MTAPAFFQSLGPFLIRSRPATVGAWQHTIFLNSYNERQKTDLVGIVHVPTPPMGLYSKKHPLGTPIKPGSTVAVPNDPVNLQRALWVLRDLGLIEIRDSKPIDVTELDVIKNPGASRSCHWKRPRPHAPSKTSISPPFREISRSIAA